MPPRPAEGVAQREIALLLRAAIDTARRYPTDATIQRALDLAGQYPAALRSSHVRHNLGEVRWAWLADHGVYPVGEAGEIEGSFKGTITPDVVK